MRRTFGFFDSGNQFHSTDAQAAKVGGIFEFEDSQPTLTDGFGNKYWFISTTAGNVTVTLPTADEAVSKIYTVKRKTGGANSLTVVGTTGNIDGTASHSISFQHESYSYTSDGNNYWII